MSTEQMPVTDAVSYELAFHVLPTVAEGEVATVFQSLKDTITKAGGTLTSEEAPERFELAYDIVRQLEGRNRKFSSAYFGWVRFTLTPDKLTEVSEAVDGTRELLRHLLIRLTKMEEANPFLFHEALAAQKQFETIDAEAAPVKPKPAAPAPAPVEKAADGEATAEKVE